MRWAPPARQRRPVRVAARASHPPPARQPPPRPHWALVLGGGAARGFAHIGVLEVLQQEGLRPDLIVGCSARALIGALFASGMSAPQMEELALKVRDSEVADIVSGSKRGMVAGEALQSFEIMASSLTRLELRDADVVIKPDLARSSFTDFSSRNLMMTLGEQAARRALPQIRVKLPSRA